ncbi:MAG: glycosyltransferase [Syntrophaceae bacterium]|nr:glycosyltransferase [Syntrophaceae bacterium]
MHEPKPIIRGRRSATKGNIGMVSSDNITNNKNEREIDLSIIIVCMNNLGYLCECLDSIIAYTFKTNYEIIIVAYFFSRENLELLKQRYPIVKIIESNEIRGFAENNNLALHQVRGEYTFVLNDDTKFNTPVVDLLFESMKQTPDATVMSPKTLFEDGRAQSCGRPKLTFWTYLLSRLKLWNEQKTKSSYTNQKGTFQSYNIVGAAFMIKTEIFQELGFFDETYFFCPEDIALSTLANKRGYKCYVDESISLYHLEGGTSSEIKMATFPTSVKGNVIFYSGNSIVKKCLLTIIITIESVLKMVYWGLKAIIGDSQAIIMFRVHRYTIWALYSTYAPKEVFLYLANKIEWFNV